MGKRKAWNKGKKGISEETRQRMRESHLGHVGWNKGKKISKKKYPNYGMSGKQHSKETKRKIGEARHKLKKTRLLNDRGYVFILKPEHHAANRYGYVREHRVVMENKLGRDLSHKEIVHHENGIRDDNRAENPVLFPNNASHAKFHSRGVQ